MTDFPPYILLGIILVLTGLSAFFSSAETAMIGLDRYRLRHLAVIIHAGIRAKIGDDAPPFDQLGEAMTRRGVEAFIDPVDRLLRAMLGGPEESAEPTPESTPGNALAPSGDQETTASPSGAS